MKKNKFYENLTKTYVIAEIGVNHNNNLEIAKKLIKEAKFSGAYAVKFQTFSAEKLVIPGTRKVKYQKKNLNDKESHYEMIKYLELSKKHHKILFNYCKKIKIEFISTPYDVDSAKFLTKLGVNIFKTASADLIDYELHKYISQTNKPVIISTGMSTIKEITATIKIYKNNKKNISLLHCVSNYPCSYNSLNINSLKLLTEIFNCPIGYSDHSKDNTAACLAIALGSKIIEKHFTLDKGMKGPDHKASCTPKELKSLVMDIRKTELILGKKEKKKQKEEDEMSSISRKSLYYIKNLKKNSIINKNSIFALRPGNGISPMNLPKILGKKINKEVKINDKFKFNQLKKS